MTRIVELPEDLIQRAERLAASGHLSLEEFLSFTLNEQLNGLEYLQQRAALASDARYHAALDHARDFEPADSDR